ncbi:hypothetical protein KC930_00665 [Candidatus Saccharibacteria bacterium]|nr:hypothetical protein [Candidatus Saccharibacteria bacterium]
MSLSLHEALERLKSGPSEIDLADFPLEKFLEQGCSDAEIGGLQHQWFIGIVMRRCMRDSYPELTQRRKFEQDLSARIGTLASLTTVVNLVPPEERGDEHRKLRQELIDKLSQAQTLHHLTFTADQAELCAQAF